MTIDLFDGLTEYIRLPEKIRAELDRYLDGVWSERPLFLEEGEARRKNGAQRFVDIREDYIKARNYVGFIQYEDIRINIYPRIFFEPDKTIDSPLIIRNLLKWLSYCKRIHFPFTDISPEIGGSGDWLEAFIFIFANYTKEAVNNSPHFAYEEVTEEMQFVRGRIAFPEYFRNNVVTGRLHAVPCTYNPFIYDNLFNRVVKYTVRVLLSFTRNSRNIQLLTDILFTLDEVSDVVCSGTDCDRIIASRLYPEVDKIRNMCRMFIHNHQLFSSKSRSSTLCVLLPMEVIFEQYVAGFLSTHFPDWDCQPQAASEYLAMDQSGGPVFRMFHDILLPGKMIIDTKYKFRFQDGTMKSGISQGDMYQLVSYCLKRDIPRGFLLYPENHGQDAVNDLVSFEVDAPAFSTTILAGSMAIDESDMENFDQRQKAKFKELLDRPFAQKKTGR